MPLTCLDPTTTLIIVDLQKGIVSGSFIHPIGDVIERTRALLDVFRAKNLPVVLVNVAGRAPGRTELGPAATHRLPRDGPTCSRNWISSLAILSSQSEAGAHLQQRILKASSGRAA